MSQHSDFFKNPALHSLLVGLVLSAAILFFAFTWAETRKDQQQAEISSLQKTIEETRPPADNPETDWQRTMRTLAAEQYFFWGRRIIRYAALLPEQCRLTSIHADATNFSSTGLISSSPLNLRISELGDYVVSCLNDPILKKGQGPFYIIKLQRETPTDVGFTLTATIR